MELVGDAAMRQETARRNKEWAVPAFESLFAEYYGRLVGVLRRMLRDRARAEELAAEAFLRLFEQPPDKIESVGGWLYRTATRLGLDSLRAEARQQRNERRVENDLPRPATPLDDALRQETCQQVRAALARLKPVQTQLLTLRSHGLSYKELAEALGIKPQSVGPMLLRSEAAFEKAYRRVAASWR